MNPLIILYQHWNLFQIGLLQATLLKNFLLFRMQIKNILYFNEDPGDVAFNYNEMGIVNIDLNNINLDDSFDQEDPNTIILIRLSAWHTKFEKCEEIKKELNQELISVAWHPNRC